MLQPIVECKPCWLWVARHSVIDDRPQHPSNPIADLPAGLPSKPIVFVWLRWPLSWRTRMVGWHLRSKPCNRGRHWHARLASELVCGCDAIGCGWGWRVYSDARLLSSLGVVVIVDCLNGSSIVARRLEGRLRAKTGRLERQTDRRPRTAPLLSAPRPNGSHVQPMRSAHLLDGAVPS